MKLLDKLKSRRLPKFLAAAAVSGAVIFGGNSAVDADSNSMWAFKEAYLSAPVDNRIFHQGVVFFGTTFHVDVEAQGQILRDASMRMAGSMNWEYTNPSNNLTSTNNVPFYIEQAGDDMTFYVQRRGKWSKFSLPGMPVGIANAMKSTDIATLQENLKAVKDAELFRENDAQQIFNVTLDGKYLAELLQTYDTQQDTTALSAEEVAAQKIFFHNLGAALQATDIVVTWTVNRQNGETISTVMDLTQLMRAYARHVLDEAAVGGVVLSEEDRMLMETIGYYSEFHTSKSYAGVNLKLNMTPPAAARKATVNNNIFQDFLREITTTVKD